MHRDDSSHPAVGQRLRALRREVGLSRRQAARATGLRRSDLAAFERDGRPVPDAVLATLCELYGAEPTGIVPNRPSTPVEVTSEAVRAGEARRELTPDASDDEVLARYLELIRDLRGASPVDELPLRDADLDSLARALGGTPERIESRLVELVHCTRREARDIRRALLRRRILVPAAGLALGVSGLSPTLARAASNDASSRSEPMQQIVEQVDSTPSSASTAPDMTVPTSTPVDTPDPQQDPVARPDQTPDPGPSSADQPAGHDTTEIGDPLVATRGSDGQWAEIIPPLVIERDDASQ